MLADWSNLRWFNDSCLVVRSRCYFTFLGLFVLEEELRPHAVPVESGMSMHSDFSLLDHHESLEEKHFHSSILNAFVFLRLKLLTSEEIQMYLVSFYFGVLYCWIDIVLDLGLPRTELSS